MLVLTRKVDEAVVIGNADIVIKVVEVRGDKVKIGFEASPDIPINRSELWVQKQEEIWQQIQQKASADVNRVATPGDGESGRQAANTQDA